MKNQKEEESNGWVEVFQIFGVLFFVGFAIWIALLTFPRAEYHYCLNQFNEQNLVEWGNNTPWSACSKFITPSKD